MKKILLTIALSLFLIAPAGADTLLPDNSPYINPDIVTPSSVEEEEMWLEGLLDLIYDDPSVWYISKDETDNPDDDYVPGNWLYAILKYGTGQGNLEEPTHFAIMDDGDFVVDFDDILELPDIARLSHITYFGGQSVPEPATMFLLGAGLVGLAGMSRKKFKK